MPILLSNYCYKLPNSGNFHKNDSDRRAIIRWEVRILNWIKNFQILLVYQQGRCSNILLSERSFCSGVVCFLFCSFINIFRLFCFSFSSPQVEIRCRSVLVAWVFTHRWLHLIFFRKFLPYRNLAKSYFPMKTRL